MGCGLHENKEAKDGAKMAVNALYASKPRHREEVNIILSKEESNKERNNNNGAEADRSR